MNNLYYGCRGLRLHNSSRDVLGISRGVPSNISLDISHGFHQETLHRFFQELLRRFLQVLSRFSVISPVIPPGIPSGISSENFHNSPSGNSSGFLLEISFVILPGISSDIFNGIFFAVFLKEFLLGFIKDNSPGFH